MYTLRCTRKLLRRLGQQPVVAPSPPTTRLGDWYANVVTVERRPFVIAVSERAYLPVVVPLREATTLRTRIQDMVGEVLLRLPVPQQAFEEELLAMDDATFGKTASRRTVGVLVDFAHLLEAHADRTDALIALSLHIAGTPCGPLKMERPRDVAKELLGSAANSE